MVVMIEISTRSQAKQSKAKLDFQNLKAKQSKVKVPKSESKAKQGKAKLCRLPVKKQSKAKQRKQSKSKARFDPWYLAKFQFSHVNLYEKMCH